MKQPAIQQPTVFMWNGGYIDHYLSDQTAKSYVRFNTDNPHFADQDQRLLTFVREKLDDETIIFRQQKTDLAQHKLKNKYLKIQRVRRDQALKQL